MRSLLDMKVDKPAKPIPSKKVSITTEVRYIHKKPVDWDDDLWGKWLAGMNRFCRDG